MMKNLKSHVPTMIGIGICVLVVDVVILLCRMAGMARETAIYIGVLVFAIGAALITHLYHHKST